MKKSIPVVVFLFGSVVMAAIAQASTHEFFKGKTIRFVVGNSAGGAMDDWSRFIARHLGKHIPGNPDIVVQNMPGAGGVTAANYIYSVAKPDGLALGLVNPALYIDQLIGSKEVRFDWPKLSGSARRKKSIRCCLYEQTFPPRRWTICATLPSRRGVRLRRAPD